MNPGDTPPTSGTIDAQRAFATWRRVIADDELYRAVLGNTHATLAQEKSLDDADLAALDAMAASAAGTRWNIVNLRYRSSLETMLKLKLWMPLTTSLVSGGSDEDLIDLCHEYLAAQAWDELGHRHFAECARFAAYVRDRVTTRGPGHEHFAVALHYETELCALLASTRDVPQDAWPPHDRLPAAADLWTSRPIVGPAHRRVRLDTDITAWIAGGRPEGRVVDRSVALAMFVPDPWHMYWVQVLTPLQAKVLDACTGERTVEEITRDLSAEGTAQAEVLDTIAAFVRLGGLVATQPGSE